MSDLSPNDDEIAAERSDVSAPDAHGHAALLLVESLIHGLIGKSIISLEDAVEIVETATDVNEEFIAEMVAPHTALRARALLKGIANSLSIDLADDTLASDLVMFDPKANA